MWYCNLTCLLVWFSVALDNLESLYRIWLLPQAFFFSVSQGANWAPFPNWFWHFFLRRKQNWKKVAQNACRGVGCNLSNPQKKGCFFWDVLPNIMLISDYVDYHDIKSCSGNNVGETSKILFRLLVCLQRGQTLFLQGEKNCVIVINLTLPKYLNAI